MRCQTEPDVVERAREGALGADRPLVLAVSGGLDSMVLLDAMAIAAPDRIAAVATFDHATGPHSARAAALVRREGRRRGLRVVTGHMPTGGDRSNGLEAMWRAARHGFLRRVAASHGARIVTAHTRDDQIETVLLRVMRGAGARGLAGLAAPGPILRPLLDVGRAALQRYADASGLAWVDDPSNAQLEFMRNRVRLELLPALRAVDSSIDDALWSIGERAARWRAELEALVDVAVPHRRVADQTLVVAASELADYDRSSLAALWGALAGRVGLALDRRGTTRCATFTMKRPHGGAIPLSGGWRLEAVRDELVLGRLHTRPVEDATLPDAGAFEWGGFRFTVDQESAPNDEWSAELAGPSPVVRRWRAGDRLAPSRGQGRRRVTRYLSDARIAGSVREDWPVVVQGGEVVWIPGVRRSDAATARSGRPTRRYVCERAHG
ncbi:MAG TPA: tRNA lysidine(34) synthetase TilS [Gemmatimonadaceae bacterium]|nr:tRNA lysidine(34) synthetase TilS [Gemmatimonadaceae bacterium]